MFSVATRHRRTRHRSFLLCSSVFFCGLLFCGYVFRSYKAQKNTPQIISCCVHLCFSVACCSVAYVFRSYKAQKNTPQIISCCVHLCCSVASISVFFCVLLWPVFAAFFRGQWREPKASSAGRAARSTSPTACRLPAATFSMVSYLECHATSPDRVEYSRSIMSTEGTLAARNSR